MVLKIAVADQAGFCFGVQRAIDITMEASRENHSNLYVLGPLIHNPQVVSQLEKKGVRFINDFDWLDRGRLIIRSHGVAPEIKEQAASRGLKIIDATCPFVSKAQNYAHHLYQQGYQVLISGDKNHPEVTGILGYTDYHAFVIEKIEDLEQIDLEEKVGVVAQTTQSVNKFERLISLLVGRAEELKIFNTICTTTEKRQSAALNLAEKMDIMFVIGGYNSANTSRLATICGETGTETHHVETAHDLKRHWFKGKEKVGVTAGASTPKWIIKEVVNSMKEFEENYEETEEMDNINPEEDKVIEEEQEINNEIDQDTPEPEESEEQEEAEEVVEEEPVLEEETAEVDEEPELEDEVEEAEEEVEEEEEEEEEEEVEDQEQEMADMDYEGTFREFRKGEVVEGTVVQIKDNDVYVDIGYKTEGIIPIRELDYKPVTSPTEVVSEGDEIEVFVLKLEDDEGNLILSKKRVDYERAWERVIEAYKNDEVIEGEVTKVVKGGLVVDLGLRGFIPASHVAIEYVENLDQYVGQELRLKVIEVERQNNNVVLSRKQVLEQERSQMKEETLDSLEEGQVIDGKVTKIVDFGAFVDIGGVEGLLHISEMSWGRIGHPSEVVEEGEDIQVKVLGVNREEERISLGLKQILPDPWDDFVEEHYEGEVVSGTITKLVSFGAFMKLEEGIEGLIHISQLSHRHIPTPDDVVSVGDEVNAKIININKGERKVGLSLKEVEDTTTPEPEEADEGGITIGDMVGDIFNDLDNDRD